jgi:hypothetical protein
MEPIEETIENETCTCGGECHCHEQGGCCTCEEGCDCEEKEAEESTSFYPKLATMRWDADDFNDWD